MLFSIYFEVIFLVKLVFKSMLKKDYLYMKRRGAICLN